ncbi:response regulator [Paenibacillus eucommiae]|uniref:response regulator n=1 Tax=Paenibacillus eucommiae TaxID=1355755 RepID=UPI0028B08E64|nr:response regulator [Paenibacillus eucommiae]
MLLVDDEPMIVEGLYNMLNRIEELELIVWKAHSAMEGIQVMQNNRIDILITDVRMPGMSGIELIGHVRNQWHHCKVIFLSGYSDYEYLQSAFRQGAFDYLLKPAKYDTILDTLQRVIQNIHTEWQEQNVSAQAELHMQQAQNLLQKDFFQNVLGHKKLSVESIAEHIHHFQIPLSADLPLILMIGRVDRWPAGSQLRDKLLLEYAVNNIVEDYLQRFCQIATYSEQRYMIWFIQLREPVAPQDNVEEIRDLPKLHWYIGQLLEKIQQSIQQYIHLPVSFVLSKSNVNWPGIPNTYEEMCEWMRRGIGLDEKIILVEHADLLLSHYAEHELSPQEIRRHMNQLLHSLESGDNVSFHAGMTEFFRSVQKTVFLDYSLQMEIFCHLSTMFLSFMNARKITKEIGHTLELKYLANYGMFANWAAFEEYCSQLATLLFMNTETERKDQKKEIIDKVDAFVIKSLNKDISLDQLSSVFHLSPYYLSRLYHAEKGITLSERIKQLKIARSKELLLIDGMKIQEVSNELGFDSVSYFTKFFKKNVGVTPQEYKINNSG